MKKSISLICLFLFTVVFAFAQNVNSGPTVTPEPEKTGIDLISAGIGLLVGLVIGYFAAGQMSKKS